MPSKLAKEESGYSLVEVMASIMILAIAIVPMVSMFDAGLRAALLGSNYDTARAFANQRLEEAKSLRYSTVRDNFPAGTGAPSTASGSITSSSAPVGNLPNGSHTVTKQYKAVPVTGTTVNLNDSTTNHGIIEVSVTVTWGASNSYTATSIKSR